MRIKVTNKLGLPEAFVEAIQNDPYDPDDGGQHSDYTITGLLKPPRMAQLARENEIVEDAADRLFSLQGQIIHGILERAKDQLERLGYVVEKRFYRNYEVDGRTYVVSAKVDVYDPQLGRLSDYKYTSVGAAQKGLKDEHKWQVNFQAELVRQAGYKVLSADATILMRDWSAERDYAGYPTSPCSVHRVPLLSTEEIDAFVVERIRLHEAAKQALPECSAEERWQRDEYAVVKKGTGRAIAGGVKQSLEEATELLNRVDPFSKKPRTDIEIQHRPGKSTRCLRYCPVRYTCTQGLSYSIVQPETEVDKDGFTKVS